LHRIAPNCTNEAGGYQNIEHALWKTSTFCEASNKPTQSVSLSAAKRGWGEVVLGEQGAKHVLYKATTFPIPRSAFKPPFSLA